MADYPHVKDAQKYARDVIRGKIPACKWIKLACQRHLDDLKLSKSKDYPYRFDEKQAERVCRFAELWPHVKGKWARKVEFIRLEPWQKFILCCVFGWLRKKDGKRRYREVLAVIPRKNGKSVLAAIIGLYMLLADGEHGAEIYSGATTEKQAWEIFRPAKQMLEKSPDLVDELGVEVWAKTLVIPENGSRFEPIIGKPGDGSSPSCALVDEFHEHDTPDMVDTMQTGMGAREQPLLVMITTTGYNLAGPCYDKQQDAQKVLEGTIQNDEMFAVIYGIDEEDDWTDPKILKKANPNFGISVDGDFLEQQQRQAVINTAHATRFKTKHLNVWCSARTSWMNMPAWNACADKDLTIDEFEQQECVGVLDLASKIDVCAFAKIFTRKIGVHDHYYAFVSYYLPENTIENDDKNAHIYRKWVNQGHITPIEGYEIDFDVIKDDVVASMSRFQVSEVAYDPWRASHLAHQLMNEGAEAVEYRQTVQLMSAPMKELEAAVVSGRFHHDGNPVTTWMISNVTAKVDAKDNIFPRKEKPHQKIDGAVSLIMGIGRAMATNKETSKMPDDYTLMVV